MSFLSPRTLFIALSMTIVAAAAACHAVGGASTRPVVKPASPAEEQALLEPVRKLEGEWVTKDEKGQEVVSVFKPTSNGTAVREIMFVGTPHEMTNVYHMDGPDLVVTHYCAMGNQPRMRAKAGGKPGVLEFTFDGVSNLQKADEPYMGSLTITIVGADTMRQDWRTYRDGKLEEQPVSFEFKRKK